MKHFKKKHTHLPTKAAMRRLIHRYAATGMIGYKTRQYNSNLLYGLGIPDEIVNVCLAKPNPDKRMEIMYYPDLFNFLIWDQPNRSLPVAKFFYMFRGMLPDEVLDKCIHDLTNFRLEFYTTEDDWVNAYDDDNVHSCMSQSDAVALYVHPENHLALAVLYAPNSNTVVARTIVNTEEKWYVRLFGDKLLVDKLKELGYSKLDRPPSAFKMYGTCAATPEYVQGHSSIVFPYFDFHLASYQAFPETLNTTRQRIEVMINQRN